MTKECRDSFQGCYKENCPRSEHRGCRERACNHPTCESQERGYEGTRDVPWPTLWKTKAIDWYHERGECPHDRECRYYRGKIIFFKIQNMNILKIWQRQQMSMIMQNCLEIKPSMDFDEIQAIAYQTIEYVKWNAEKRKTMKAYQEIENIWYESLRRWEPDYGIYCMDNYIAELFACWNVYSIKIIKFLSQIKPVTGTSIKQDLSGIKTIVDLWCGLWFTTAWLKETFPDATVFGIEFPDGFQFKFASKIWPRFWFSMKGDIHDIWTTADLILASEYFEHILDPISHLEDIIHTLKPKAIITANAFWVRAAWHFIDHNVKWHIISGKEIWKVFRKRMRELWYEKQKTWFWNDRPNYWTRIV